MTGAIAGGIVGRRLTSASDFVEVNERIRLRITLIHGTFARDAAWTRPSSDFCAALLRRLPPGTQIDAFPWSGGNSHRARLAAADQLVQQLRDRARTEPNEKRVLIAHSHGGNVALYALRDAVAAHAINGLVFMGTPFLRVQARGLSGNLDNLYRFWLFIVVVVLLVLTFSVVAPMLSRLPEIVGTVAMWAFLFLVLLSVALKPIVQLANLFQSAGEKDRRDLLTALFDLFWRLFFWLDAWSRPRLSRWIAGKQSSIVARLSLPQSMETPMLSIAVSFDEASIYLRALRLAANTPSLVFRLVSATARVECVGALIGILLVGFMLVSALETRAPVVVMPIAVAVIAAGIVTIILFACWLATPVLQAAMAVVPLLTRAHRAGYGGESIFDNWLADISVERRPSGAISCENVELPAATVRGRRMLIALNHSRIYACEEVAERIAEWIRGENLPFSKICIR